jgi:hypothetical protein
MRAVNWTAREGGGRRCTGTVVSRLTSPATSEARAGQAAHGFVTPARYLVGMMIKRQDSEGGAARGSLRRAEAMLAAAGLRATRVERCPDPACPLCARSGRAAA